jgi:thiosulfate reductase cytochrome b subunit
MWGAVSRRASWYVTGWGIVFVLGTPILLLYGLLPQWITVVPRLNLVVGGFVTIIAAGYVSALLHTLFVDARNGRHPE